MPSAKTVKWTLRSFASSDDDGRLRVIGHLTAEGLSKTVRENGRVRSVLTEISLRADAGRTLAVVGPTGAGKTTLLRVLAGLTRAESGEIRLGGRRIDQLSPQRRGLAMVFQSDALVPTISVRDNLYLACKAGDAAHRAIVELFNLEPLLDRVPSACSGGERRRVELARALLSRPQALLLDEPLAHVDPQDRSALRYELTRLRGRFAGPVVVVTHDHREALTVADELAVMLRGRIVQSGPPERVFDAPATIEIARFLGDPPMNVLDGAGERLGWGDDLVGIRPERLRPDPSGWLRGRVVHMDRTGSDAYVRLATPYGDVVLRTDAAGAAIGEELAASFDPAAARRYARDGGRLII